MPDPIDTTPPSERTTPNSAGPSQDMLNRFAVLDTTTHVATPSTTDPLAPTFVAAGAHAGLISIDPPAASTRYTFEAVFASGGLGQIRRAYDHRLQRYVAVKELRRSQPDSTSELRVVGANESSILNSFN